MTEHRKPDIPDDPARTADNKAAADAGQKGVADQAGGRQMEVLQAQMDNILRPPANQAEARLALHELTRQVDMARQVPQIKTNIDGSVSSTDLSTGGLKTVTLAGTETTLPASDTPTGSAVLPASSLDSQSLTRSIKNPGVLPGSSLESHRLERSETVNASFQPASDSPGGAVLPASSLETKSPHKIPDAHDFYSQFKLAEPDKQQQMVQELRELGMNKQEATMFVSDIARLARQDTEAGQQVLACFQSEVTASAQTPAQTQTNMDSDIKPVDIAPPVPAFSESASATPRSPTNSIQALNDLEPALTEGQHVLQESQPSAMAEAAILQVMPEQAIIDNKLTDKHDHEHVLEDSTTLVPESASLVQQQIQEAEEPPRTLPDATEDQSPITDPPGKKLSNRRRKYTIRQKDTLESIAFKKLGDETLNTLIYEINKEVIQVLKRQGKELLDLKAKTIIWLPSPAEISDYRGRPFISSQKFEYVQSHLLEQDVLSLVLDTNSSGRDGKEVKEEQASSRPGRTKYLVRLGDTLRSIAMRHPALSNVSLWKLLAQVNDLPVESDSRGGSTTALKRGTTLWIPAGDEIEIYRTKNEIKKPQVKARNNATTADSHASRTSRRQPADGASEDVTRAVLEAAGLLPPGQLPDPRRSKPAGSSEQTTASSDTPAD